MQPKNIYIGTSGWSNRSWTEFYPAKIKGSEMLEHYAQHFNATEVNSSFYHIPRATTTAAWMAQVPSNFRFCPKVSRFITHIKRLREPVEPMARIMASFAPLTPMIGPILVQLPPSLKFDKELVQQYYQLLKDSYGDYQFAIEPRHETWYTAESYKLMRKYKIANVISESGGRWPFSDEVTASTVYIRFHGPGSLYNSPHSDEMLQDYADRIKQLRREKRRVWVFFNNTMHHDAVNNATTLMHMLGMTK